MIPRPRFHFTPSQNFMNDPNGLVFFAGEYHLFYQHNPFGETWGHMSWGHAVSRDLIHWEHLPVALHEENELMIFSGSAVVDWHNTSGFGSADQPPLIAIYTSHGESEQTQNIAYSIDRGRTWTKYDGNPVIAIGSANFRDPKVLWHAPTQQWIMLTVLADQFKVRFDGSPDLKHWTHLSDFGPAGKTNGLWECPDLFQLAVAGQPDQQKWILKVDVQHSIGAQCFVGEFDGRQFISDWPQETSQQIDYGMDFYAAQSWSDQPDDRRIWIAWMNNWHYANAIPTSPWRGLFSIPRELHLQQTSAGLRLIQQPIEELRQVRQLIYHNASAGLNQVNVQLARLDIPIAHEITAEFEIATAHEFGIKVRKGAEEETVIGYDVSAQEMFVDRRRSSDNSFSDKFAGIHRAPLAAKDGRISLNIFVDACSVEVFGNEGQAAISDLIFPSPESLGVEVYAHAGNALVNSLNIWRLDA